MPARFMLPILAAAALVSWNAPAAPKEAPASDFEYKRDGKSVTLTKYKGNASELIIPEKIDKFTVTELGEKLFEKNTSLVRVSIPDTATRLGESVFDGCTNLESVKMSKNIERMGTASFRGCSKLTEISFPKKLAVGIWMFNGSDSLGTLITGDGAQLLRIGMDIHEYTVPASVRDVERCSFENAPIERVVFEEGTVHLRRGAFYNCRKLTSVTLPQTLASIQHGAFAYCVSLAEVIFMGNCPTAEDSLFKGSAKVTVYYNPSAKGWKPDGDGKWAEYGVPLVPLDKAKLAKLKLPPPKLAAPAPAVAAPAAAPAPQAVAIQPPANTMPAAEFDALYAEKLPLFPPALQKLHTIFTNETAKIDLDRVRGHAAALEEYATKVDKLPAFFAQKVDLEGVKAAKAAKELTFRGEVDTSDARPELAALAAAYAKRCAAADAKAADAVVALAGKYINALTASLRELLQKKDLPTAELYKLEIDSADRARYAAQTGKRN